jgi:hypothetical protein
MRVLNGFSIKWEKPGFAPETGLGVGADHRWAEGVPGCPAADQQSALTHTLFSKMLSDCCRNLTIGHLICRFNTNNTPTECFAFKAFLKLALCLARTDY